LHNWDGVCLLRGTGLVFQFRLVLDFNAKDFCFPQSVFFHQCPTVTFIYEYMLFLPEGQTGEAFEPSKEQRCWRNRGALVRTVYWRARLSLEWKQCLLTYRLQTRAGPVSLTYQKRVSFSQTLHPACGPSYSTMTSLTCYFHMTVLISLAVTSATSLSLSQSYKQDCHRITNGALSLTHSGQQGSGNEVLFYIHFNFIHLHILLGQTWVLLYETMPKHAACLIIYIVIHEYNAKSEHFVSLSVVSAEFISLLDETARDVLI
jgi:hypothetical protein